MIEVQGLTKDYGERRAIHHLDFSVQKGEVVGFLGPNGAGKSTTMRIVTGSMAPSDGQVTVGGYDVFENPLEVKSRIGFLPETPPVYQDMFVEDFLSFVARLKNVARQEVKTKVDQVLEKTNLGEVRRRLIGNLSKGYRQRVGLAQALVSEPEVLILDEPTVGLDPRQVAEIRGLIHQLRGQHTIVLSTHILPEVQASCDRVIIINEGHIVAKDSIHELSRRMSANRRVHLGLRRQKPELVRGLQGLNGIIKVEMVRDGLSIETEDSDDVVENVAKYVVEQDAGLIEMKTSALNLEDIFMKLTSKEESDLTKSSATLSHSHGGVQQEQGARI